VLIVEGTLLFRRPVDEYLDYRIYLDIPFDEVVRRAQVRDVPRFGAEVLKKYSVKYIPAQQQYLESVRPAVIADMVIDNSDIQRPAVTNNAPPPSS
jgi:uridine kinase